MPIKKSKAYPVDILKEVYDDDNGVIRTIVTNDDGEITETNPFPTNPYYGVPNSFNAMSRNEKSFSVKKGQLNKNRLRPQILNEHQESSRELLTTVTATNKAMQIFRASHDNINGMMFMADSGALALLDDFDAYTSTSNLQSTWAPETGVFDDKNTLDTSIKPDNSGNVQSMKMGGNSNGNNYKHTFSAIDFTSASGLFEWRQDSDYSRFKWRVYISDGTNEKYAEITSQTTLSWEQFVIAEASMTEAQAGITNVAAITSIRFEVLSKDSSKFAWVDNLAYIIGAGDVDVSLVHFGSTEPISGVTKISDGTVIPLGDLGLTGQQDPFLHKSLTPGKRLYYIEDFVAGVSLEMPGNTLMIPGDYYGIVWTYHDTETKLYGADTSFEIDYYQSGYACTAPDDDTPITSLGQYADFKFNMFSTQDVYIIGGLAKADEEPGINASYSANTEDKNMKIVDVIMVAGTNPGQIGSLDLSARPALIEKGGKAELMYSDDFSDDVSFLTFDLIYLYERKNTNG